MGFSGCGTSGSRTSSNGIAVADTLDNRVILYNTPITTNENAAVVLGQTDFTHVEADRGTGAAQANTLSNPSGIAKDAAGNLYVADWDSCRVLRYEPPFSSGMNASLVIGQSGFVSPVSCNSSASGMGSPSSVAIDSHGNLWVADLSNERVLEYVPPFRNGMAATLAIGQTSTNATIIYDNQAVTASTLSYPTALAFDSKGNLWVSDSKFNRVLEFVPPFSTGMAASLEIGQPAVTAFTSSLSQAPSVSSLSIPAGLAFDSNGNLWVADQGNNRVLEYVPPFTSGMGATTVVGQRDFTHGTVNQNGSNPAANTLSGSLTANSSADSLGVGFDASGDLLVSDTGNNRVLIFTPPFSNNMSASSVLGQSNFSSNDISQDGNNPAANTLFNPFNACVF